ncbi:hypothetical protein FDR11_07350 [Salmonella enterica]|nr:hypothetical protein [Salmonella enterica]EDN1393804.1 hypothetical protein [Salmonella enterica]
MREPFAPQCRYADERGRIQPDGSEGRTDPEQVPEHHRLIFSFSPHNAGFFTPFIRRHQTQSKRFFYLTTTAQHHKRICAVTLR